MEYIINMETLKRLCDVVGVFTDEMKICITADKWVIRVVDPAHVAMADIEIPASEFLEYSKPDGGHGHVIEIGTDVPKLAGFFKVFPAQQRRNKTMSINYDIEKGRFKYSVETLTKSGDNIDIDGINAPKLSRFTWAIEYDATVEGILSAVRASKDVTDVLLFTSDGDGNLQIIARNDHDTEKYDFPESQIRNTDHGSTQFGVLHSRDYLYDILKNLKKGDIAVSSGTDAPLRIEYRDRAKLGFGLTMMLAPRIEGSDDKPTPDPEEIQGQPDPGPKTEEVQDQPEPEKDHDPEPKPEPVPIERKLKRSNIPAIVKKIMPEHQQKVIIGSEEHWGILKDLKERANEVPKLYSQEYLGKDAIVYLHYFSGGSDWYITEWDGEDTYFGYAILGQDSQMSEFGYPSRIELTETPPVELDFFWTKTTLQAALEKVDPEYFTVKETEPEPTEPVNVAEDLEVKTDVERIRNTETGEAADVLGWTGNTEGATVQKEDGSITWWKKELTEIEA